MLPSWILTRSLSLSPCHCIASLQRAGCSFGCAASTVRFLVTKAAVHCVYGERHQMCICAPLLYSSGSQLCTYLSTHSCLWVVAAVRAAAAAATAGHKPWSQAPDHKMPACPNGICEWPERQGEQTLCTYDIRMWNTSSSMLFKETPSACHCSALPLATLSPCAQCSVGAVPRQCNIWRPHTHTHTHTYTRTRTRTRTRTHRERHLTRF